MIYNLVIILTIICAILLICIVLIQKSKGGGLGSSFASSNSILGVKRTNDVVEKATWWLAGIVCFLSILSVFLAPSLTTKRLKSSIVEQQTVNLPMVDPNNAPAPAPAPAPGE